jgi:hypothetical protein
VAEAGPGDDGSVKEPVARNGYTVIDMDMRENSAIVGHPVTLA